MDPEYKKMMTWIAVTTVASLAAAAIIVAIVMRVYGAG